MNDDDLTSGERADLRARLLEGTRSIKPVGRHRTAWIASTVAVVLVAGLAATALGASTLLGASGPRPISTPTSTPAPTMTATPTPTLEPSPSPTPSAFGGDRDAVLPFGGDCNAALDGETVRRVLGSEPLSTGEVGPFSLFSLGPVSELLGGLNCFWTTDDMNGGSIGISVYPSSVVTEEVAAEWSDLHTEGLGSIFEKQRRSGDLVIGARATPLDVSPDGTLSEQNLTELERRIDALIDAVARNAQGEFAEPAERADAWWQLGTCADLSGALSSEVGALDVGFPGDNIPVGMTWRTLVGAGAVDWCSWYSNDPESFALVELYLQPGVGRPDDSELARSNARPAQVAGAEESWIEEDPQQAGSFDLLAVSGPNRLSMRFAGAGSPEAAESLAAAFLAQLG